MPVRKLKPVEAFDGSYKGAVLGLFDQMEAEEQAQRVTFEEYMRAHGLAFAFAQVESERLERKAELMRAGKFDQHAREADDRERANNRLIFEELQGTVPPQTEAGK